MRRLTGVLVWLLALGATPALAEAPAGLRFLEANLNSLANSSPGNIGIAAIDLRTGELVAVHGDEPFPMASTVKIAVAANYLAQVEFGRRSLDERIGGRTASQLMHAMITRSDNHATDLLIRNLGGPDRIQEWLDQRNITGMRIDRNIAQLLAAKRDLWDVRDSSTPKAMVELLRRLDNGTLLRPWSRAYLLNLMSQCITGRNRMRAMLPVGTRVEHKTGTLSGYSSDVGFITLPDGRRLAVAFFARATNNRPRTIAAAARAVYDGFVYYLRSPYTTSYGLQYGTP
ncbi:MAG TPA: serine hydrolase [Sphingomicrobium sp.]|nr:serine hydrolase [Sphingomicrobium sp.]